MPPDPAAFIERAFNRRAASPARRTVAYVQFATSLLACVSLSGCHSSAPSPPQSPPAGQLAPATVPAATTLQAAAKFTDRAGSSGINFLYQTGQEANHFAILEVLGGGVALFDYDADGDLDLFFPGGGGYGTATHIVAAVPGLFRQHDPWMFQEETARAGLAQPGHYSHGAAVGDFNNDGFPDLLVTGFGGLQLYRNQGDGGFEDVTQAAELTDALWSTSAAWGDFNGDGALDLYIAHYVDWSLESQLECRAADQQQREVCPPQRFGPLPDVLYMSRGDGTFVDGSAAAGLRPDGKGLGVVAADVDLDGAIDLYVANDTVPKFLYHNLGGGVFEEIGNTSGAAMNQRGGADGSMGIAVGDFDLDGLPDLWVANYEQELFALYHNEGACQFEHVSQRVGVPAVGVQFVGFGTVFFDFDRDGDEDLFVANGHVRRYPDNAPVRQLPLLLENLAGRSIVNVAPGAGPWFLEPRLGRGLAVGDLDDDGDLDLVVTHLDEPPALLDNDTPNGNGWLRVRLIGTTSNRDAVGARLTLETTTGKQIRQIMGGGSYLSHSDTRPFWGVPRGDRLKSLSIGWPSGRVQTIAAPPPNRTITIVEPPPAL